VRQTRAGKDGTVDGLDAGAVPSFDLIAGELEAEAGRPPLFDFGADPELPDTAPVAELPPWMRATAPPAPTPAPIETEPEPRRRGLPRARGHRRPYRPEFPLEPLAVEAPVAEVVAEPPTAEIAPVAPVVEIIEVPGIEAAVEIAAVPTAPAVPTVPTAPAVPTVPPAPAVPAAPRTVAEAAAAHAAFLTVQGDIAVPAAAVPTQASPTAAASPAATLPSAPALPTAPPLAVAPASSRTAAGRTAKAAKGDRVRRVSSMVGMVMALGGGLGALYLGTVGHHSTPTPLPESQLAANAWVMDNVGSSASVLAPATVTKALIKDGFDSGRVIPYADGASGSTGAVSNPDWKCCNVLFATTPVGDSSVRDGLPVALRPAYDQSRALASFTENGRTTEIRQVLDGTRAQIAASLASEHTVLVNAGKEVLANKKLHLSAAAKQMVTDGQVDSRVLLAIVGMAARHDVSVLDFPIGDAENAVDGLAREVRIDKLDGKPLAAGSAAVSDADAFLNMQVDPYKPARMQLTDPDGSGSNLLDIRYDAPGPLGLITPRG
jgi:hypothetical protein